MAEIYINKSEASSLADFLENHLIDVIRHDEDIENIRYVCNLVHIYDRCRESADADRINLLMGEV